MAFDRVDWDFIFSAICKFGYRNKFISTIQVAYTNIHPKFRINDLLISFTLIQGFRQGCQLLLLLCIIAADVPAIFINADTRIKGIQIGGHHYFFKRP